MDSHEETPGERAVKAELRHLKLKFQQEKKITNLRGDTVRSRVADFYLQEFDIYVEFLGNWNTSDKDKQRYQEKIRVYKLNNLKCIWIYPNELTHTNKIIQEGLLYYGVRVEKELNKENQEKQLSLISEDEARLYRPELYLDEAHLHKPQIDKNFSIFPKQPKNKISIKKWNNLKKKKTLLITILIIILLFFPTIWIVWGLFIIFFIFLMIKKEIRVY